MLKKIEDINTKMLSVLMTRVSEHEELLNDIQINNKVVEESVENFQQNEICDAKIQNFLEAELGINYRVSFGNVHHFGKPGLNGVRPIVTRFIYRREMEHVLSRTYKLKGKTFGISEQFPPEIENKRKELYPVMKKAKVESKKVKLVRDKLYINGKPYNNTTASNKQTKEYRDVLLSKTSPLAINLSPPISPRRFKRSRNDFVCEENEEITLSTHIINYPEFSELIYKNDIACFVETKTDDLDDIRLKGYKFILKNRKKVSRIKSGGIALCFKEHLHENIEVIKTDCKFVLWCKISKIICSNQDVILGIIYIPPEYTSYSSSSALDEIENEYLDLSSKFEKVFFIGDFNARTAEDRDFIYVNENEICTYDEGVTVNMVCELDEKNLPRKRNNEDKCKNRFGNQLLDFCKGNNLFIMNGRTTKDRDGNLTCRNASVVDYCILK
ncbi:unnamed protein product [Mytilus edulis]|uniref:Endonuclease/exonuclease/phosphatase domain-containing protein n=1 Tax=Mytilus edulis TaxID=6550 RepID=A0A8S3Q6Q9_MYTED|nr:unnamed protein product [Mytilus edulis]